MRCDPKRNSGLRSQDFLLFIGMMEASSGILYDKEYLRYVFVILCLSEDVKVVCLSYPFLSKMSGN